MPEIQSKEIQQIRDFSSIQNISPKENLNINEQQQEFFRLAGEITGGLYIRTKILDKHLQKRREYAEQLREDQGLSNSQFTEKLEFKIKRGKENASDEFNAFSMSNQATSIRNRCKQLYERVLERGGYVKESNIKQLLRLKEEIDIAAANWEEFGGKFGVTEYINFGFEPDQIYLLIQDKLASFKKFLKTENRNSLQEITFRVETCDPQSLNSKYLRRNDNIKIEFAFQAGKFSSMNIQEMFSHTNHQYTVNKNLLNDKQKEVINSNLTNELIEEEVPILPIILLGHFINEKDLQYFSSAKKYFYSENSQKKRKINISYHLHDYGESQFNTSFTPKEENDNLNAEQAALNITKKYLELIAQFPRVVKTNK